jgi:uncharacterized protein (TIGR00290 family)
MLDETGEHSRSHGLPLNLLAAQAESINVPLLTARATWSDYEAVFTDQLRRLSAGGVRRAVFGDLDIEAHRQWEEKVCAAAGMTACLPLWKHDRRALVMGFLRLGYRAVIVTVNTARLDATYLGRELSPGLLDELEAKGVDPAGENGEYHTFVMSGPLFSRPVSIVRTETIVPAPGYARLGLRLDDQRVQRTPP